MLLKLLSVFMGLVCFAGPLCLSCFFLVTYYILSVTLSLILLINRTSHIQTEHNIPLFQIEQTTLHLPQQ